MVCEIYHTDANILTGLTVLPVSRFLRITGRAIAFGAEGLAAEVIWAVGGIAGLEARCHGGVGGCFCRA
jgi:hypothetical protein